MTALHRLSTVAGSAGILLLAACGSADVQITPTADRLVVGEGATVTTTADGSTSLLDNDVNGDRQGVTVDTTPSIAPQHGTLTLASNGTFTYVHDGSESTSDSFSYVAILGGRRVEGTVTVDVDPSDDPPVVGNDNYVGAVGNTWLTNALPVQGAAVEVVGGLLDNDSDPDGELMVTDFDEQSAEGGLVYVAADGKFTYLPPAGFTGEDTFDYTISDTRASAIGTVTIQVQDMVWWVDAAQPAGGDGTALRPFASIDELAASSDVDEDELIYIYANDNPYSGEIQLLDGQTLHGSGSALQVGLLALPAGERPVLRNPSGNAISTTASAVIRGLDIGDTEDAGIVAGAGFGAASSGVITVRDVAIYGGGAAMIVSGRFTLDVELDSVEVVGSGSSADDPDFGIAIVLADGRFVVKGDTVIRSTRASGILLGYPILVAPTPDPDAWTDVETEFQGPVTLIDCGWDASETALARQSLQIMATTGAHRFQDLQITQRHTQAILQVLNLEDISFRDVDISNESAVEGPAWQLLGTWCEVEAASLDLVDTRDWGGSTPWSLGALPGGLQMTLDVSFLAGGVSLALPGEDPDLADVAFRIAANGPQGNGGTISGDESVGLFAAAFGTIDLSGVTFTDNPTGLGVLGVFDQVRIDGCSFTKWGSPTLTDEAGCAVVFDATVNNGGLLYAMQVEITDCEFNGAGDHTSGSPALAIEAGDGDGFSGSVFVGRPDEDGVVRGNRFTNLEGDAIQVETGEMGLLLEVVNNSFETTSATVLSGAEVIEYDTAGDSMTSMLVEDNTATGKFDEFLDFFGGSAGGGVTDGHVLAVTIQDNVVTGARAFFGMREDTQHSWHVLCTGNQGIDLIDHAVLALFDAQQGATEQTMMRLAGNSFGFATPYLGRDLGGSYGAPTFISVGDNALVEVRNETMTGVSALDAGVAAIQFEAGAGMTGSFDVTANTNGFDGDGADVLVSLVQAGAATMAARIEGHTLGRVETEIATGRALQIEERATFTTLNPGATLHDLGDASTSTAAGTVSLPEGPWR